MRLKALIAVLLFVVGAVAAQDLTLTFDVASIKPNNSQSGLSARSNPQGIDYVAIPLNRVIAEAYQVPYTRISSRAGAVGDLLQQRFDIAARADREVPKEQLMMMLQKLLADRFRLAVHRETKSDDVYKLVSGRNALKLQPSASGGAPAAVMGPEGVAFRNSTMPWFAEYLSARMGQPVLNLTGFQGTYDFTLRLDVLEALARTSTMTPLEVEKTKYAASFWSGSSIFSDIQELGLKLDADKGSVEYIIVDHVESPSRN